LIVIDLLFIGVLSRPATAAVPQFGAQVWIEPGQTPEQIDGWFATLEQGHMPVARLFLMWSYLEPTANGWDWSLYDAAFHSAERHHVAIVATLTPSGPPAWLAGNDSQGVGVNATEQERARASEYIVKVVDRYKDSPALDTWLLLNEPGQAPVASELADAGFAPWLQGHYPDVGALNRMWGTDYANFAAVKGPAKANGWNPASEIDWSAYWRSFQTSQLAWLAAEVRKHDDRHPLHLNPHALVGNIAGWSDDLPAWRGFLDTLGCSIHPAWHFGLLPRSEFALGVSYVNDLVDGAIAPKPHWVTELQGGNNISSGGRPMEPTVDDTAQWLWTSVASGAQRTIFWLLNARRAGQEAGEWSLLDFDQHPSRRLEVATGIEKTIESHADVFASATPAEPDVTLLLSLDSLTYQLFYAANDDPARDKDQHVLELLGFYKALSRIGPPPRIKHFDDYDWKAPGKDRVAILPDARVLTAKQIDELLRFAKSGGDRRASGQRGASIADVDEFNDPRRRAGAGYQRGRNDCKRTTIVRRRAGDLDTLPHRTRCVDRRFGASGKISRRYTFQHVRFAAVHSRRKGLILPVARDAERSRLYYSAYERRGYGRGLLCTRRCSSPCHPNLAYPCLAIDDARRAPDGSGYLAIGRTEQSSVTAWPPVQRNCPLRRPYACHAGRVQRSEGLYG
jgi:beta-galactosidase